MKLPIPPVYPILDTASLARAGLGVIEVAEAFLEGGAQILQFRHKGFWSREILGRPGRWRNCAARRERSSSSNDRADYAAILGAGLHVGQNDLSPEDARRVIGMKTLLGFSTHNSGQMRAAAAEPVDYVAVGPVFVTVSKKQPGCDSRP